MLTGKFVLCSTFSQLDCWASCKRYFSENFVKRKIAEIRKLDTSLEHLMLQDMLKFTHTPIRMPQVTGIHMEDEIKLTDSD